jgi:excisionase family DNA binding protein
VSESLRVELMLPDDLYDRLVDDVTERVLTALGRPENGSPWKSEEEAAQYLRVSQRTLQRKAAKGHVRSVTVGRRRLYHRNDLDRLAAGEE